MRTIQTTGRKGFYDSSSGLVTHHARASLVLLVRCVEWFRDWACLSRVFKMLKCSFLERNRAYETALKEKTSGPKLSCKSQGPNGFWSAKSEHGSRESGVCPGEAIPWTGPYLRLGQDTSEISGVSSLWVCRVYWTLVDSSIRKRLYRYPTMWMLWKQSRARRRIITFMKTWVQWTGHKVGQQIHGVSVEKWQGYFYLSHLYA